MEKRVLFYLVIVIISIFGLFMVSKNLLTGNILLDLKNNYKAGEKLTGELSLTIEKGDSLQKDTIIILSLIQNNTPMATEAVTLEEFIEKSGEKVNPVKKDKDYFYETPGEFTIQISDIIDYAFEKPGEYTLLFSILSLDIRTEKTIFID